MKTRQIFVTFLLAAFVSTVLAVPVFGQNSPIRLNRPDSGREAVQQPPPPPEKAVPQEPVQREESTVDTSHPEAPQRDGARRGEGRRGNEMALLKQRLNLSEKQSKQIGKILADDQKKMGKMRKEFQTDPPADGGRRAGRDKMMALRKDTDNKIKALLNKEQAQAFAKLQKERQQRMRQGGGQRLQGRGEGVEGEPRGGRGADGEGRRRRGAPEATPPE